MVNLDLSINQTYISLIDAAVKLSISPGSLLFFNKIKCGPVLYKLDAGPIYNKKSNIKIFYKKSEINLMKPCFEFLIKNYDTISNDLLENKTYISTNDVKEELKLNYDILIGLRKFGFGPDWKRIKIYKSQKIVYKYSDIVTFKNKLERTGSV